MMDLAIAIDKLAPAAEYSGSTTANTEAAYDALVWTDARAKPTWGEIQSAWASMASVVAAKVAARAELLAGYTVSPEGWTLRATAEARAAISDLVQLVGLRLELGRITTKTLVTILDATGTPRQVTALRLREIASDYGEWVRTREMILRS